MSSPKNPLLAQLLAQSPSRRRLLASAGAAAAVAATAAAASGCAPPPPPAAGAVKLQLPQDVSATEHSAKWANWTAYLDFDDKTKKYPTLEAFKKKTGMAVTYSEDIDDNDSYFNKIAPQLRAGQDIDRDIFVFTDWMANRVIREKLVPAAGADPHAARGQPAGQAQGRVVRPGPQVLPDLAERVRRHRLRQGQGRA